MYNILVHMTIITIILLITLTRTYNIKLTSENVRVHLNYICVHDKINEMK